MSIASVDILYFTR